MNRALHFGDVIRVDPRFMEDIGRTAYQPDADDRRWLILAPAETSAGRPWTTLSLDTGTLVSWKTLHGFIEVHVPGSGCCDELHGPTVHPNEHCTGACIP